MFADAERALLVLPASTGWRVDCLSACTGIDSREYENFYMFSVRERKKSTRDGTNLSSTITLEPFNLT